MKGEVEAVAVCGVFSPVNASQEKRVAELAKEILGEGIMPVTLSHEIGSIGILERENASLLNGALLNVIAGVVRGFEQALQSFGIDSRRLYLPKRRDAYAQRIRAPLPDPDDCLRSDELDPRRGAPVRAEQRACRRHRRHDDGYRRAGPRIPAAIVGRGRNRRRAHELPHAGHFVDRHRRRHDRTGAAARAKPSRSGRTASGTSF